MGKVNGYVLFEGKSALTDDNIVVIATMESNNDKTGNMLQTWILLRDIEPHTAVKNGADHGICGLCPQKSGNGCYVTTFQAPLSIYRAYKRGSYPRLNNVNDIASIGENREVRLGAYGDPAAAPFEIFEALVSRAKMHTGYTHQIKHKAFDMRFTSLCMISAETKKQAQKYHAAGLRTFRATHNVDDMLENENACLADSKGLTCIECGQCDGATKEKKSYVVLIHGAKAKRFKTDSIIATSN